MRAVIVRCAAVAVVLALLVSVGVRRLSDRDAGHLARGVAAALLTPMASQDFRQPGGIDRVGLLRHLQPFLADGVVKRVKVLAVRGDRATVVFSDEPRTEGLVEHPSSGTASVPGDENHRYERSLAGATREVFFAFQDARGNATQLELYVPVDATVTGWVAVVVVAMLLVLPVALLGTRQARRDPGPTRRDLARRLHDDVLPELAGARMLVDNLRNAGEADLARAGVTRGELADRLHAILTGEIGQIRALLSELVPPEPAGDHLPAHFADLVARLRPDGPSPAITTAVPALPELPAALAPVLLSVGGELVRNAIHHAGAGTIRLVVEVCASSVRLTVTDDGTGFDPSAVAPAGHVGLRLIRGLVREHGGVLRFGHDQGTTVTVTFPLRPRYSYKM
ncbi:sensor histidine kinase [Paractinoplanes lichenicola]|uniref:ATP-binding protein n=1 Tax=Paractinoplanes lichenicola TaxID=2802976 RepID=A0ABS1W0J7_9ACTN|nr:ATP-binding protein [Actinoplanes lichenicola]MBL7260217.1 ATP-binding protein [Actinoplanes lichenicola]